eukprot:7391567-Prymnesium_polylepis.6
MPSEPTALLTAETSGSVSLVLTERYPTRMTRCEPPRLIGSSVIMKGSSSVHEPPPYVKPGHEGILRHVSTQDFIELATVYPVALDVLCSSRMKSLPGSPAVDFRTLLPLEVLLRPANRLGHFVCQEARAIALAAAAALAVAPPVAVELSRLLLASRPATRAPLAGVRHVHVAGAVRRVVVLCPAGRALTRIRPRHKAAAIALTNLLSRVRIDRRLAQVVVIEQAGALLVRVDTALELTVEHVAVLLVGDPRDISAEGVVDLGVRFLASGRIDHEEHRAIGCACLTACAALFGASRPWCAVPRDRVFVDQRRRGHTRDLIILERRACRWVLHLDGGPLRGVVEGVVLHLDAVRRDRVLVAEATVQSALQRRARRWRIEGRWRGGRSARRLDSRVGPPGACERLRLGALDIVPDAGGAPAPPAAAALRAIGPLALPQLRLTVRTECVDAV